MKKILISLGIILVLAGRAYAGNNINIQQLRISGVPISDKALTSGVMVTSDSVRIKGNTGFSALVMECSGDVDITFQVSTDGTTWYSPYTTDGSSLTAAYEIVTALDADRWIVLPTRLAPYVRFRFDPDATSTISATYLYQEGY